MIGAAPGAAWIELIPGFSSPRSIVCFSTGVLLLRTVPDLHVALFMPTVISEYLGLHRCLHVYTCLQTHIK